MTVKPMKHQAASLKFMAKRPDVFDISDPGTGKTLVEILDFAARRRKGGGCAIIFAPKSLLDAAWKSDFHKFAPDMIVSVARAANRAEAFAAKADVYVTNIDAAVWVSKQPASFFKKFDTFIVDESDTIKHRTSARSKAAAKIAHQKTIKWRRLLSGTPNSNGICDLWHQYFVLDGGKRLGKSFFGFRSACCIPTQVGPQANMLQWEDKPGIEAAVASLVADITIRHKFEDCVDIPENHCYAVPVTLSPKHLKTYRELEEHSLAVLRKTTITAVNGAVLATKLLQTSSGAVYDDSGGYSRVSTDRYELTLDLVEAREHSVVFYAWDHQLEELVKEAEARELSYAVWDPDHPMIATQFQEGEFRVLFAHPASAGHGLTLTRGTATIWPSPTYNLTHFQQGLKRIHRIGQKQKTETIVIVADGTIETKVWAALQAKKMKMDELFDSLEEAVA